MKKFLTILLALLFLLCGCSKPPQTTLSATTESTPSNAVYNPVKKNMLSIYAIRPDTLNPLATKFAANRDMLSLVFDPLVSCDSDYNLKMNLANGFRITDGGKKLTVNLKNNIIWHDGSNFSSSDVKYTMDYITQLGDQCCYFQNISNVVSHGAINSHEYMFELNVPDSGFIYLLDFPIIKNGSVKTTFNVEESEEQAPRQENMLKPDFEPIGTGMYILQETDLNKDIQLLSNSNWHGGVPTIPSVSVTLMPDYETFYSGFKMDSIDVAMTSYEESGKFRLSPAIKQSFYTTGKYVFLAVNFSDTLLSDKKIRQILNNIVSTTNIQGEVIPGYSRKCVSPLEYETDENKLSLTPDNIKDELEKYGCTPTSGSRAKAVNGVSHPFVFSMLANGDDAVKKMIAEYIADAFVEYGIMINISYANGSDFAEKARSRRYDFVLCETELSRNRNMSHMLHSEGSLNIGGYANSKTDELVWLANTSEDIETRNRLMSEVNSIFKEDIPHIPLFFYNDAVLYDETHIETVFPGAMGREYDGVYMWRMKQ